MIFVAQLEFVTAMNERNAVKKLVSPVLLRAAVFGIVAKARQAVGKCHDRERS